MGQVGELDFENFKELIRQALPHLHDPAYEADQALRLALGCDPSVGSADVQSRLIAAIRQLEPDVDIATDCLPRRAFLSLNLHFVLGLTQEETADRLFMSRRNLQRVQIEALHILARRLWSQRHARSPSSRASDRGSYEGPSEPNEDGWQAQASAELAMLLHGAPQVSASISEVIDGAMDLIAILGGQSHVKAIRGYIQPGLEAAVHPSALRQTLISAAGRLVQHVKDELTVSAVLQDARVELALSGPIRIETQAPMERTLDGVLLPSGTTLRLERSGDHVYLTISVSPVNQTVVLVIEDNPDMVDFYRRCTAGTTYSIIARPAGQTVEQSVAAVNPDIVVLDVMMPDEDGWELLSRLHEDPDCRQIPLVVCSVVREEQLALALGAAAFLSKPVRPRDFVQTLDQVRLRV